jgi:glycosyltransferase involved in cell wall biosynthesis
MAAVQDVEQGYRCHRMVVPGDDGDAWVRWLRRRLEADAPDIVLGAPDPGCPMLNAAAASGIRSIYVANNLAALDTGRPLARGIRVLANSPFTAAGLAPLANASIGIVLPVFGREECLAPTVTPTYVSFINPIPEKGVAVATEVASRLPEERFLFVKGNWSTISAAASEALVAPARRLANVTVWEYQHDMRTVYGQSGILFLPSQFLETFGRVIVEAQQNGIPVVASPVAAVPYVVGDGGIVVDRKDEPEGYVRAIRELRATQSLSAALREAALANRRRT